MKNIFKANNYRFGIETMLSMYLDSFQFVLGADLEDYANDYQNYFNDTNPCNIYFVLKRPKVTVDPNSIKIRGKKARFKLLVHTPNATGEINISFVFNTATSKIDYHTQYPYNMIAIKDQTEPLLIARPSTLIDSSIVSGNTQAKELDYEVLYIGQAFGKTGKRTAMTRLASHETVQQIYTHALTQFPESDIWILLTRFSQLGVMLAAGSGLVHVKPADKKVDRKKAKHFLTQNGEILTERQKINLTEAALIKYFEPEYNVNFKQIFPSSKHTSYADCYKLDLRAINIEVDLQEHIRKLFTKKTGRKSYHSEMFEFKTAADRMSFLDMNNMS